MMFKLMNVHSSIDLINTPLPPKHPKITEIWQDFTTFKKISKEFEEGKVYQDTFKLGLEIRKCFNCYTKIYCDEQDKLDQVAELEIYFEGFFEGLDNKAIGASVEPEAVQPPPPAPVATEAPKVKKATPP